ncbi:hypothetical protein IFR05_005529 [Cadophora sp. M221]|nr:hypothetical protein IFR05_005529 [Cadophora sp. M221]
MSRRSSVTYFPINENDSPSINSLEAQTAYGNPDGNVNSGCLSMAKLATIIAICVFSFGLITGWALGNSNHLTQNEAGNRMYDGDLFRLHAHSFNGSFLKRSVYSGKPNDAMDRAWGHFTDTGSEWMPDFPPFLRVPRAEAQMATSHSLDAAVQSQDENGSGYLVSLEMFHQLHCLDMIRKFVHFDYYQNLNPEWAKRPLLRQHADHCIDMLREVLMCQSDTGLITYHWVKNFSTPMPDFSTPHSCRDPEAVLRWTKNNEFKLTGPVVRRGGEMELDEVS